MDLNAVSLNAHFPAGPFVQCVWTQHSVHHHLYTVDRDVQHPHILSGPRAPGEAKYPSHPRCWLLPSKAFLKFVCCAAFIYDTRFSPSWRRIAPAPSIRSAPPLRMPSWLTSWTLRSLFHPSLHHLTTLPSTPAAQRQTLKGTSDLYEHYCTVFNNKYCTFVGWCIGFIVAALHITALWRVLSPCTLQTAPLLMKLWWDRELPARWACVFKDSHSVLLGASKHRNPSLEWKICARGSITDFLVSQSDLLNWSINCKNLLLRCSSWLIKTNTCDYFYQAYGSQKLPALLFFVTIFLR